MRIIYFLYIPSFSEEVKEMIVLKQIPNEFWLRANCYIL